jgi:hypothetical protein
VILLFFNLLTLGLSLGFCSADGAGAATDGSSPLSSSLLTLSVTDARLA